MVSLFQWIDWLGTFAFALSGGIAGVRERFDLLGVFVLALITAVGGGVMRDVCIGALPPAGLTTPVYLTIVVAAVICVAFWEPLILSFERATLFFDALGLGFFAAFGAHKTALYGGGVELAVLLGVTSAVGGGCLRDLLTGRAPGIFSQEIYATAALVGALIEVAGGQGWLPPALATWSAIGCCSAIRLLSLHFHLRLPVIRSDRGRPH
ncbi:trimeric intracellular cation channel family protein [Pantoea sp. 1.19]|uniref:trimeric intracellular cation channel family protein n=1 Tax=Pantoea sp. 1.19 TaxID=1925589 RepID=UPI00094892B4|nr:trimeric intracellular cation channel family protein [Pantoea sp. 1.19]